MSEARKDGHAVGLGNSFSFAEVKAFLDLHACLLRGGDARQIAHSAPITNLARKFARMRRKHELACAAAGMADAMRDAREAANAGGES